MANFTPLSAAIGGALHVNERSVHLAIRERTNGKLVFSGGIGWRRRRNRR